MGETLCQGKCGRVEGQSLSVTVFLVRAEECFNAVVLQVRAAEPWNASVRRHQGAMNCRVSEHQVTLTSVLLPDPQFHRPSLYNSLYVARNPLLSQPFRKIVLY